MNGSSLQRWPFLLTKSSILILKILGITVMALLPISLASSSKAFLAPVACEEGYSEEIYAVARVVWKEARSEPEEGKRMVVQVIKNRAEHYKESILETTRRGMAWDGKLEPKIVELVVDEMEKEVCHGFRYWLNTKTATDRKWVRYAKRQDGLLIGNHFFFE